MSMEDRGRSGLCCSVCSKPIYNGELYQKDSEGVSHTACVMTLAEFLRDDLRWCPICKRVTLQADLFGCCAAGHDEKLKNVQADVNC